MAVLGQHMTSSDAPILHHKQRQTWVVGAEVYITGTVVYGK